MPRTIDALRQLQDLDTRVGTARATIAQISGQLKDRRALQAREQEIKTARTGLQALDVEQRDLEMQAEDRRAKIKSDENKLYGGRVTSAKELASLSDEVAQDRRQLSTVEDRLLELLDKTETQRATLDALEATLARESREWQASQENTRTRLAGAEQTIADSEAQRDTLAASLGPATYSTYETLRRQKGGVAVAMVHQRTCQACRVGLTPSQEQRARIGTELVPCNSCGRILFVSLG